MADSSNEAADTSSKEAVEANSMVAVVEISSKVAVTESSMEADSNAISNIAVESNSQTEGNNGNDAAVESSSKSEAEPKKETKDDKYKKSREFHRVAYSKSANNQVITKHQGKGGSSPSRGRSQSATILGKEKGGSRSGTPRNEGSRGATPKNSRSGTPKVMPKFQYTRVNQNLMFPNDMSNKCNIKLQIRVFFFYY